MRLVQIISIGKQEVHFRFENPTDRRNRILSGLVPQV